MSERSRAREQSEQCGANEWVSGVSERANGRASGPVLQSVFLAVVAHSVKVVKLGERNGWLSRNGWLESWLLGNRLTSGDKGEMIAIYTHWDTFLRWDVVVSVVHFPSSTRNEYETIKQYRLNIFCYVEVNTDYLDRKSQTKSDCIAFHENIMKHFSGLFPLLVYDRKEKLWGRCTTTWREWRL